MTTKTLGLVISLVLFVGVGSASAANYIVMPSSGGNEAARATTSTTAEATVKADASDDGEGITPVYLEIGGVEGDSGEAKGNVEYEWKVEEGEKAQEESGEKGGTEDINIGVGELQELRGGISVAAGDIDGLTEEEKAAFLLTVKSHAQVRSEQDLENFAKGVLIEDENVEDIAIGEEGVQISYRMPAKFLGVFDATLVAETEVEAQGEVKVAFPWYGFLYKKLVSADEVAAEIEVELAKGENKQWVELASWSVALQAQIATSISNVLKTRHDTAKNSIGNIR